jgi:hypothetical protein
LTHPTVAASAVGRISYPPHDASAQKQPDKDPPNTDMPQEKLAGPAADAKIRPSLNPRYFADKMTF